MEKYNQDRLAAQFESNRTHLRSVAYRMLGSLSDAEDAVQESWIRLIRSDTSTVENLGGWLTTVVSRVSLDIMRSRKARREDPLEESNRERVHNDNGINDPKQEAQMADSVGLALLVVLEALGPAERVAFVLHDMFDISFEEIAVILKRSPVATRQLASRARRRVRGTVPNVDADRAQRRQVVDSFLAASRAGDFNALLAVLHPDVTLKADPAAMRTGAPMKISGAEAIAKMAVKGGARAAQAALINGTVGVIVAPRGKLLMVINFTIKLGQIIEMEVIADPDRLHQLDMAILDD